MKKLSLITQTSEHFLRPGCELLLDGKHVVVNDNNEETVSLQCPVDNELRTFDLQELDTYFMVGRLVPRRGSGIPDADVLNAIERHSLIATCSSKAQKRVLELKSWINALKARGINNLTPDDMLKQHMKSLLATHRPQLSNVSAWTLYRNEKKLRDAGGDNKALIPKYHQRGKTAVKVIDPETGEISQQPDVRLAPKLAQIVSAAIEEARQDEKRLVRPFEVFRQVKLEVEHVNKNRVDAPALILPSKMTVSRWMQRGFTSHEMAVRSIGKKGADKLFRRTGARIKAERILQISQHDDIDTRVFLIDELTGQPWGTAYMTFCVDEYSRAVLGCKFGFEHRSIESALATLFHGIRRKDMSGPEYNNCKKQWLMHGVPGLALLDNASYNAANAFHLTLMDLGMDYAFAKPHTPTDKSAVEFFNGQFKRKFAASLPGESVQKGDRDASSRGMKTATMTLEELNAKSMDWIVDEYLHERNDSGWSPVELWNEQAETVDLRAPEPKITEFLKHSMVERLSLRDSGGLLRNKLRYQSDEIEELQRRVGPRTSLDVRVNVHSLASIYVRDPQEDRWLHVPCIEDARYVQGLTDAQHKLVMKAARGRKKAPASVEWARKTKDELLDTANRDSYANDLKTRGSGYRIRKTFESTTTTATKVNARTKTLARCTLPPVQTNVTTTQPSVASAPDVPLQTKVHPSFQRMMDYANTLNT
jgi:hypothetical protein